MLLVYEEFWVRKTNEKAINLFLRTLLICGCGSTNDADRQDVLQEAAYVINRVISEGEFHFAVTAVGNTSGQVWSHARAIETLKKSK